MRNHWIILVAICGLSSAGFAQERTIAADEMTIAIEARDAEFARKAWESYDLKGSFGETPTNQAFLSLWYLVKAELEAQPAERLKRSWAEKLYRQGRDFFGTPGFSKIPFEDALEILPEQILKLTSTYDPASVAGLFTWHTSLVVAATEKILDLHETEPPRELPLFAEAFAEKLAGQIERPGGKLGGASFVGYYYLTEAGVIRDLVGVGEKAMEYTSETYRDADLREAGRIVLEASGEGAKSDLFARSRLIDVAERFRAWEISTREPGTRGKEAAAKGAKKGARRIK